MRSEEKLLKRASSVSKRLKRANSSTRTTPDLPLPAKKSKKSTEKRRKRQTVSKSKTLPNLNLPAKHKTSMEVYEGSLRHGLRHGPGVLRMTDGTVLKGAFRND
jgi:hypothetical protein